MDSIIKDRKPDITVYNSRKNTQIAFALVESFQKNKLVDINLD